MIIVLGSKNQSKERSLEMALTELGITDFYIETVDSLSNVSSKPIGYEIIRGAENRNQEAKKYANSQKIKYDYLCAIEGGFSIDENGLPFVVTYAVIEDALGKKSTGKSIGIRLRKEMLDYLKEGGSINRLIEEIKNENNNKSFQGITGYLTNGLYPRDGFDKEAVISAFIPILFKDNFDVLSEKIKKLKNI